MRSGPIRLIVHGIGESRGLAWCPSWDRVFETDPATARVLGCCQGIQPLESHTAAVAAALGAPQPLAEPAPIQLAEAGLLVPMDLQAQPRPATTVSHPHDLNVPARRLGKPDQVGRIGREDLVAVGREEHERGVDDIARFRQTKQFSGGPAKGVIERPDVNPLKRLRQPSLPRPRSPPRLTQDAGMRARDVSCLKRQLQPPPHRPIGAIDRHERARIEHDTHAAPRRRLGGFDDRPRTTVAAARSSRRCSASSASVRIPNSDSNAATAPASARNCRSFTARSASA